MAEDVWRQIEAGAEPFRDSKTPTLSAAIERYTTTTSEGRELVSRWRRLSGILEDRSAEGSRSYAWTLAEALARDMVLEHPELRMLLLGFRSG